MKNVIGEILLVYINSPSKNGKRTSPRGDRVADRGSQEHPEGFTVMSMNKAPYNNQTKSMLYPCNVAVLREG